MPFPHGLGLRRVAAAALVTGALGALASAPAGASTSGSCLSATPPTSPTVAPSGPLGMGIYPGGPVGTVSQTYAPVPENTALRLQALQSLRGSSPLTVHLYNAYSADSSDDAWNAQVGQDIAGYEAAGIRVELVDEYRPTNSNASVDVPGFAAFVRGTVRRYGSNPLFVSLQVTNEANVTNAPGAADGAYSGVQQALVAGVEAAKSEIAADGYGQIRVGFNWAYSLSSSQTKFFSSLAKIGGPGFARAVDWVGVDAYPGVWSSTATSPTQAASVMVNALRVLRQCLMPTAGIASSVPEHVSENGYPTSATNTYADQAAFVQAEVSAVARFRSQYAVSDYRFFDLRDSNSSDPDFESQYGLLRDDYSPKPAFFTYQAMIPGLESGTTVTAARRVRGASASHRRARRRRAHVRRHRRHAARN
jgi:hypothetical protein